MQPVEPISIVHLFPALQQGLHDLLAELNEVDWLQQISNSEWTVKDVTLHLLGGDVGILSRERDEFYPAARSLHSWDELVYYINQQNDLWVQATRRISPRLLRDMLILTAPQVSQHFNAVDPDALGNPVSWAGPEPAPIWLHLAREYTERWYHQQQIRLAVEKPGFKEPAYFSPVLDAFTRALPHTFRDVDAENGSVLTLVITGDAGGSWSLRREGQRWVLYKGTVPSPQAVVTMDQDLAWQAFTKGIVRAEAIHRSSVQGETALGLKVFDTVSIIA